MNPPSFPTTEAKTSSLALWSLVLGILSITCLWLLGSIPAIILGILAIKKIDGSGGTLKGRGMGIAGMWALYPRVERCQASVGSR